MDTDRYGLAIDIGTSGLRAQRIDLDTNRVVSTAITLGHPIPGANVIDHLHFSLDLGQDLAHLLIIRALDRLIDALEVNRQKIDTVGVCGNPIQLSIFQNMEIRDLAFAGPNAKKRLGVEKVRRNAKVVKASQIGLDINPEADVLIPPAVEHEIGADALAMMHETGFLENDDVTMVTDFGTNAEMALKVDGEIFTGSAAAGPAIEGQHISGGMLAAPGAICDVESTTDGHLCTFVLDDGMNKVNSDVIDPLTGRALEHRHLPVKGITGTGVIGLVSTGLEMGLMRPGRMETHLNMVQLQSGVVFDEDDLVEVGKTIAAFIAGHMALAAESGISLEDVRTAYMSGASGTYMSPQKAMRIGLIPGAIERTVQAGNTSLAMARDLVRSPELLDRLQQEAESLRAHHVMFAGSKVFRDAFAVELGIWGEGMPLEHEERMLRTFGLEPRPTNGHLVRTLRLTNRDIDDIGRKGLKVVDDIGIQLIGEPDGCIGDAACVRACNEKAIGLTEIGNTWRISVSSDRCMGTACRRCEDACTQNVLRLDRLRIA